MKLPAYPRYKPSSVEWLGDVPKDWDVKRLKFVFPRLFSGVSVNSDNSPTMDESPAILKTSCVYGNRFRPEENKRVLETELDRVACSVTRNSLIISRMNTPELVGSCGYVETDFSHLFLPDRLWIARFQNHPASDGKFSWYLVISHAICALTGSLATGTSDSMKNLTQEAFLDIPVGVPPPAEQWAIATFLDRETGRVDRLVAKKRELIERLREKRTALISRTVTRGLPPASPPLKPSGHPWLDEIPKHWEVKRLKEVSVLFGRIGFRGYSTDDLVYEGEGAISMSPSNMADGVVNLDKCTWLSWEKYHESPEIQVQPEDVIMVKTGSTLGKTAFVKSVPVPMTVNPQLMIFKEVKCSKRFLFYYLFSNVVQDVIPLHNTGSTIPTMTQEGIGKLPFPHPPLPEQAAIAAYLDLETAKLDALVGKVEEAVERLQEYRTALITAAVTGKIDVRKEVAQ